MKAYPNGRHVVPDSQAGEVIVDKSIIPNGRHAVSCPVTRDSVWNDYIGGRVTRCPTRYGNGVCTGDNVS